MILCYIYILSICCLKNQKHTLAGVALCLLRFCPDLLLPFLWVTEADKRSSSGTEFNCCGLCAL